MFLMWLLKMPLKKIVIVFAIFCVSAFVSLMIGAITDPSVWCEHDYSVSEEIASTCLERGKLIYVCSKCGSDTYETLDKASHTMVVENGWYKCSVCDYVEKQVYIEGVEFDEIYRAYKENELRADDKYKNNLYRVTAKINGMTNDGLLNLTGGATLTMEKKVDNTIVFFLAEFGEEQESSLKQVSVGDTITFEGKCLGAGSWTDCKIIFE